MQLRWIVKELCRVLDSGVGVEGCGLEGVFFYEVIVRWRLCGRVLGLAPCYRVPSSIRISMAGVVGACGGERRTFPS
jgi:hypothetical protein